MTWLSCPSKGIRDALLTNKVQQIWWPLSSLHPDLVQVVEGLRNDFVHCLGTVPSFVFGVSRFVVVQSSLFMLKWHLTSTGCGVMFDFPWTSRLLIKPCNGESSQLHSITQWHRKCQSLTMFSRLVWLVQFWLVPLQRLPACTSWDETLDLGLSLQSLHQELNNMFRMHLDPASI